MSETITVQLSSQLQKAAECPAIISVTAASVDELVALLKARYASLHRQIVDDTGEFRRFVRVYVDGVDIRRLSSDSRALKSGSTVSFIPALSGG
ncbi:MoaD/ThiS family protein [Bradyrhizobium sp. CB1015]|uniref:MoaD/ThiS family protein n=1 Tax=Bradyrhizobium sp. CB1015 TaxID=2976822 RepID=UPI003905CF33